jgi:diguanylate cyclase (GGDEF)-like protein
MDLYMPRLDGFSAFEDLKRDPSTADVPVIFLSAQRDDLTRVRGLDLGAADFLAKPFSGSELRARVDKAVRTARQREQLRALAQTDALTSLPNFRSFRARLDEEVLRAKRYRTSLAALMIDLDNLKPVNDQLGHDAGNRAIVAAAEAILGELRATDFAARWGGDEFAVLLPHTSADDARALGERLRRAIRRREIDGGEVRIGCSVGVAALPPGADARAEDLLRAADAALYRAKRGGRDRVCVAGETAREAV